MNIDLGECCKSHIHFVCETSSVTILARYSVEVDNKFASIPIKFGAGLVRLDSFLQQHSWGILVLKAEHDTILHSGLP